MFTSGQNIDPAIWTHLSFWGEDNAITWGTWDDSQEEMLFLKGYIGISPVQRGRKCQKRITQPVSWAPAVSHPGWGTAGCSEWEEHVGLSREGGAVGDPLTGLGWSTVSLVSCTWT